MKTTLLATKYPCCGGPCRIRAIIDVPREVYDRTCSTCGQRWLVDRRTAKASDLGRIDVLEWTHPAVLSLLVQGTVAKALKSARTLVAKAKATEARSAAARGV